MRTAIGASTPRSEQPPTSSRGRRATRSALLGGGLALLALVACATVTREEPPSRLEAGAGAGGTGPLPALGSGGTGVNEAPMENVGGTYTLVGGSSSTGSSGALGLGGAELDAGDAGRGLDGGGSAPSGTVLLAEDFEQFDLAASGWVLSEGSAWAVTSDPDVAGSVLAQSALDTTEVLLARAGDTAWTDVSVEVDMKIVEFNGANSSFMAGLCVRVSDAENFHLVGVRSNDARVGLRTFAGGGNNVVQSDFDGAEAGTWYSLRVDAIGDTLRAYLDGELMFSQEDATHERGAVALCTVRAAAAFDNLRVTAP